jgi:hypothetical protein
MKERSRWLTVVFFAAAMAWVESAVVYYLRTMIDRIEPYQPNPLPVFGGLGKAEFVREIATLIMLAAVGILAGKDRKARFGYFLIAFGAWDIFYYVFLKVITGWPNSIFDWDVLFLVPLPWWGPVWAPVSIALGMIVWGTLLSQLESYQLPSLARFKIWGLNFIGCILALYVFMSDTLHAATTGGSLRRVLPVSFNWPLFSLALILMAVPILDAARQLRRRQTVKITSRKEERA